MSTTTTVPTQMAQTTLKSRLLNIASDVIQIGMPVAEKIAPTEVPLIEASAIVLEGLMTLIKAL